MSNNTKNPKPAIVPTPLSYFDSHIRGAKEMGRIREVIANASQALEKYSSSTSERDKLTSKLELHKDDEILRDALAAKLATFKASDSDARKLSHIARCVAVNGLVTKLQELCEASRFMDNDEAKLAEQNAMTRDIAAFAERFIPTVASK